MIMSLDVSQIAIQDVEDQTRLLRVQEFECYRTIEESNFTESGFFCPAIWDGILCWNETEAGTVAAQPCPGYVVGFKEQNQATKWCNPEGKWYFNVEHNTFWTNYTQCVDSSTTTVFSNFSESSGNYSYITDYLPVMKSISQIGYSVSLVTLIIAFLILAAIKKLRCPRNTLHMHLFVSFILRAFMALLKDGLFVQGVGLPSNVLYKDGGSYFLAPIEPNWECKIVTSLWQFCIMANYSWILMEGLYLHNLIFLALFSDTSAITLYVLLGWGLPFIFVSPWVAMRIFLEDTFCWTTNKDPLLFLIIRIPTSAFILINFALFVNIVRVLLLKLRASVCKETNTYRRWAKSTLVLVPLFGVHYTLFLGMSYSIGVDPTVELVWLFCDQLFASFQGFFVAVLYCFMNGEVLAELGKKWHRMQCQRNGHPDSFVSNRKRRSWANSVSWLTLGAPHWPGAKARANKRTASSMQYTDHSQVSCCSNLVEGGMAVEQIVPGSLEMRYIRPH